MSSPVIVALDFASLTEAKALVAVLGDEADHYKVGLQLLTEAGPEAVRWLVQSGKSVFLDLKLHEIPNSVAGGVHAAGKLGAHLVTVHASGGGAVLRAAVAAARPFPQLKVLALTVITSLSDADLPDIGPPPSVEAQVSRLAALAASSGCHGVVASALEAGYLRQQLPAGTLIVTPGIQLPDSAGSDQARVATPKVAAAAGATHVVVGRAIAAANDPLAAYRSALTSFQAGTPA
jgi:orotidine-5'-phosphate decarboxylase